MAALLRSLATKMARASPPTRRLPAARGLQSGPGRPSSKPNTSPPPPPPPLKPEEVLAKFMTSWESMKVDFAKTAKEDLIAVSFNLASALVLVGTFSHFWIMPKVNESLSRERSKMKDELIQTIKQEFEIKRIPIEGE